MSIFSLLSWINLGIGGIIILFALGSASILTFLVGLIAFVNSFAWGEIDKLQSKLEESMEH